MGGITAIVYLPFLLHRQYFLAADLDYKNIGAAIPLVRWFTKFYFAHTFSSFQYNASYHLAANVFLHLVNVVLVFSLFKKLTGEEGAALTAGLIFALHYLSATIVLQVTMACELLSTMFCLLSLLCFIEYHNSVAAGRRIACYGLSFLFFTGSILSRATSLVLPAIILVYDMLWRAPGEKKRSVIIRDSPFFIVSLIYLAFVLFFILTWRHLNIDNIQSRTEMILRAPWVALASFNIIWAFLMVPFDFQGTHEAFFSLTFYQLRFSLIIFSCLLPCLLLVRMRSKNRMYAMLLSWLLVFSVFFALNCRRGASDLYMYLPTVASSFLFALIINDLSSVCATVRRRNAFRLAATVAVAGLLLFSTCRRQQARYEVGQMVHNAVTAVISKASSGSSRAVVYAFDFPLKIKRWPAFADNFFLHFESENVPVEIKVIDYRRHCYSLPAALYIMTEPGACKQGQLSKAAGYSFAEDYGFRRSFSEAGVDNCFLKSSHRYVFTYRDGQVQDLSDVYFPGTKVIYKIKGQGLRQLSLVGDFNDWDAKANPLTQEKDGDWTVSVVLQPNQYRYQLLGNGAKALVPAGSRYHFRCPGHGACSMLLIPNTALPPGLLPGGNAVADGVVIQNKERLLFAPDDRQAHIALGNIYRARGFNDEADFEYKEAEGSPEKGSP